MAGPTRVTVGATLLTSTWIVSVSAPPSSSATVALTVRVPLSFVEQEWVLVVPHAVQVRPLSQLNRNSWVSAVPGSTTAVSDRLMFEPSATVVGALKVAVGSTLVTVRTGSAPVVVEALSSSITLATTEYTPLSGYVQSKVGLGEAVA